MKDTDIFLPSAALFFLVMFVLVFNLFLRIRAARNKHVPVSYFKLLPNDLGTEKLIQAKNNITNLFETPVFFYLISVILFVTENVDPTILFVAWLYVAFRVLHSVIHLTSNFVPFRLASFVGSLVCLTWLWLRWLFLL